MHLTAEVMAATRFAISPLLHTLLVLSPENRGIRGFGLERLNVGGALAAQELHLLSSLRQRVSTCSPLVPVNPDPHIECELQRMCEAPTEWVAREVEALQARGPVAADLAGLTQGGGKPFVQRLSAELKAFWGRNLAPLWPMAEARVEADVKHRSSVIGKLGLGAALESLHPSIRYCKNVLIFEGGQNFDMSKVGRVTLCPTVATSRVSVSIDPWDPQEAMVVYPAFRRAHPGDRARTGGGSLEGVIGYSRSLLLTHLGIPRTTTELADQHHMSPSTVSYHLAKLHRIGLLKRTRVGKSVYYQRVRSTDAVDSLSGVKELC
ncbi:helix-turn-helix domain-containing protein [Streptomyces sp. E11-3]|uniref:ArsR/SmtB family transcription factor n=1 Tax=Streptomyces sp. E11-3 TaxID=3110112 RepID=UPI0039812ACE